ncbi:hypothetical protein BC830DRAFT_17381 [Chytriomyces sp. MP71]|nr:hypothetical protein BC830DRAFT_17381 [Chytriomyces sp. MP71]
MTTPSNTTGSGWIAQYQWSLVDNSTWASFLLYQLYYSLVLFTHFYVSYKPTAIWGLIFCSIIINVCAAISGFAFLDCYTFTTSLDPNACIHQLHPCYAFEALCFMFTYVLLFYRKYRVAPSTLFYPGLLDFIIMLTCISFSLALNVPCIYGDIATCFQQDIYQATGSAISFLYFDLYYILHVSRQSFKPHARRDILHLCLQTGSISMIYLTGSIAYKAGVGNYYTNMMWNMGWCMVPVYATESVLSSKFQNLLFRESAAAETPVLADFLPGRADSRIQRTSDVGAGKVGTTRRPTAYTEVLVVEESK